MNSKYSLDKVELEMTPNQGVISIFKKWLRENYTIKVNALDPTDVIIEPTEINPIEYDYDISDSDIYLHALDDGVSCSRSIISNILSSPNHSNHYNPVREYFSGLKGKYKGRSQIDFLCSSLRYSDESRKETYDYIIKKWFAAMVACVNGNRPNDVALGLVSERAGIGKTTFFSSIIPPAYDKYRFDLNKNSNNNLYPKQWTNKMLIMMDELSCLCPQNVDQFKQLMSSPSIAIQQIGRSRVKNHDRMASVCFTSNRTSSQGGFLKDSDQGLLRRLATVEIDSIQDYREQLDVDELWAEAVTLVEGGFDYTWSQDDYKLLTDINGAYVVSTNAMRIIRYHYRLPEQNDQIRLMTSMDILRELKEKKLIPSNMTGVDEVSIGKAMTQLGFTRRSKRVDGKLPRYYYEVPNIIS